METVINRRAVAELGRHFAAIEKHVPLRPIRSDAEYEAAVSALNALLDAGAADEDHPLAGLAATLGELVGDYDSDHYAAQPVSAPEMLHHLMEAHNLKQGDLPEIGSQGVVSEVLRGHRDLNLRQIRALAKRFGISAAAFIEESRPRRRTS